MPLVLSLLQTPGFPAPTPYNFSRTPEPRIVPVSIFPAPKVPSLVLSLLQIPQVLASNSLHLKILPQQPRLLSRISNSVSDPQTLSVTLNLHSPLPPKLRLHNSRGAPPPPQPNAGLKPGSHPSPPLPGSLLERPQLCDPPEIGRGLARLLGPLGLASGSPSSSPEPTHEPRLAGILPAAGRGLAGWSHLPVARRRPTRPPFASARNLLKDSDSLGGGATSLGWRVARTSKLFPSNQLLIWRCPRSNIVSIDL